MTSINAGTSTVSSGCGWLAGGPAADAGVVEFDDMTFTHDSHGNDGEVAEFSANGSPACYRRTNRGGSGSLHPEAGNTKPPFSASDPPLAPEPTAFEVQPTSSRYAFRGNGSDTCAWTSFSSPPTSATAKMRVGSVRQQWLQQQQDGQHTTPSTPEHTTYEANKTPFSSLQMDRQVATSSSPRVDGKCSS
jgi:hypothetical protein